MDNTALQTTLRIKHHIAVKTFPRKEWNGLRVSTHLFNTEDHVSRLITALRQELA